MTALNMTAWLAIFLATATTFAALFLIAGAVLLTVNYVLFAHGLQG